MLIGPRAASADAVRPSSFRLRIVVLDVGQGDATVVLLPGGRALLVDAGGLAAFSGSPDTFESTPGFDIGERVVWPALRALGARRLHGLVLTHGDPDHVLGVPGVLRHLPATALWEGVPVPRHQGLRALFRLAEERRASWRTVQAGDVERFGDVEVRVVHPPLPEWERQRVRNDDSVVLEIRLGAVSIVLPGDIGAEGERAIVDRIERGRLVILKAPHHGSATSSTKPLLDTLRPAAVIFSCGRDNRFGHPHPAVVERYRAIGARMFSTADDGAVFVETDGAVAEVSGWLGRRVRFELAAVEHGRGASR
jgi:competence protein ComEC